MGNTVNNIRFILTTSEIVLSFMFNGKFKHWTLSAIVDSFSTFTTAINDPNTLRTVS